MAIISKGIKLSYSSNDGELWNDLTNLQEIPDLGGTAESVEVTTLADSAHMYIDGIKNYGESLEFKFIYEKEQFTTLNGVAKAKWKVELPDNATCTFDGTSSVKLDGVGVNAPLTYTLAVKPNSEMVFA